MNSALRRALATILSVTVLAAGLPLEASAQFGKAAAGAPRVAGAPVGAAGAAKRSVPSALSMGGSLSSRVSLSPSGLAALSAPAEQQPASASEASPATAAAPAELETAAGTPVEAASSQPAETAATTSVLGRLAARARAKLPRWTAKDVTARTFDGSSTSPDSAIAVPASESANGASLPASTKAPKASARRQVDAFGGPLARPEEKSALGFGAREGLNLVGKIFILQSILKPILDAVPWPHFLSDGSLANFGRQLLVVKFGPHQLAEALANSPFEFLLRVLPTAVTVEELFYRAAPLLLGAGYTVWAKRRAANGKDARTSPALKAAFPIVASISAVLFAAAHFTTWGINPYVFIVNLVAGMSLARIAYVGRGLRSGVTAKLAVGAALALPMLPVLGMMLLGAVIGGVTLSIPLLMGMTIASLVVVMALANGAVPGIGRLALKGGAKLGVLLGALVAPVTAHLLYNWITIGGQLLSPGTAETYALLTGLAGVLSLFYTHMSALKNAALRAGQQTLAGAMVVLMLLGASALPQKAPAPGGFAMTNAEYSRMIQHSHEGEQHPEIGPMSPMMAEMLKQLMGEAEPEAPAQELEALVQKTSPAVHKVIVRHAQGYGIGSGAVVDFPGLPNGIMFTNAHVVGAKGPMEFVEVQLAGRGQPIPAMVIAVNHDKDIAFLKLPPRPDGSEWPSLKLATKAPKPGSKVWAMGYPRGLDQTVTAGTLSGLGGSRGNGYVRYIQTDAAVNPGNSGGPLLNMQGEVIGINSWIITMSGGSDGLNFAISSPDLARSLKQFIDMKTISTAELGIIVNMSDPAAPKAGVAIEYVRPGSAAEKAGIKRGDILTRIDGMLLAEIDEDPLAPKASAAPAVRAVVGTLAQLKPTDEVLVTVMRQDQRLELPVKLDAKLSSPAQR